MLRSCTYYLKDTTRFDISRKGALRGVKPSFHHSLFKVLRCLAMLKMMTDGPGDTNGIIQMRTTFHYASATITDCRRLSWQNKNISRLPRSSSVARSLKPIFHLANLFARTGKKVGTVPTCSRRIFSPVNFNQSRAAGFLFSLRDARTKSPRGKQP